MALTRWDPFTALARFDSEFDQIVRRGFGGGIGMRSGFVPPVEILTEDTDLLVRLELPGVDVDRDVEVTVDGDRLVISGERRDERSEGSAEGLLVRELRYGSFRREFALPHGVSADSIEAAYDQGMLTVRVRNAVTPAPKPKQVPIGRTAPKAVETVEAPKTD